jgi:hypothetical protein
MGTEVYSWRISSELKSDLEREARLRETSLAAVLNLAVRDWLKQRAPNVLDDREQLRLHAAAAASSLGIIAGRDSRRAENARHAIRERLRRRHAR